MLGLISPLVPGTPELEELDALAKATEAGFNALVLVDGAKQATALAQLESSVQQLEKKLEEIDAKIPMGWFREHFDASQMSSVALADYATLLGRHVGDESSRLDRIQFLLTRLMSFFISPEDDSPLRRRLLLAEALPPPTLPAAARAAVVTVCREATRRLRTFVTLKDLIGSGFFADVRGYKLSLRRQQLLEPDVMAAVIELNEATSATLDRLAEVEHEVGKASKEHLSQVDLRVKTFFKQLRVDESDQTERFEAWLKRTAVARAAGKKPEPAARFTALRVNKREGKRLVLGAMLVLVLFLLFRVSGLQ